MNAPFRGCATALITPMKSQAVDCSALTRLIERQIAAGVSALVMCGTTGEGSTLSREEKLSVITHAKKCAKGRIPIIAGCSSTSTKRHGDFALEAQKAGADALLCLTPYYNKASKDGVFLHYESICKRVDIPVIVYNIPKRTGLCIDPDTYLRLCTIPNVCAVKEASGDVGYAARIMAATDSRLALYSGNDDLCAPLFALGAAGVISAVANVVPERMAKLCRLWEEGRAAEGTKAQLELLPLIDELFSEVNPIPVKTALSMMGYCTEEMRLPLCPLRDNAKARLKKRLSELGVL